MKHEHTKSGEEMAEECIALVAQLRIMQADMRDHSGRKVWRALEKCPEHWLREYAKFTDSEYRAFVRQLDNLCGHLADRAAKLRYRGPGGPGEKKT